MSDLGRAVASLAAHLNADRHAAASTPTLVWGTVTGAVQPGGGATAWPRVQVSVEGSTTSTLCAMLDTSAPLNVGDSVALIRDGKHFFCLGRRAPHGRPSFRVNQATAQTTTASAWTTITLDTVDEDTDSGWNATTYTYTVQTAGLWIVGATMGVNGGANTGTYLSVNGVPGVLWAQNGADGDCRLTVSGQPVRLAAGATLTLQLYGPALTTAPSNAHGQYWPSMSGVLLSR